MTEWIISGILGFAAGGAVVWFCKDKIESLVIDANTLSAKLHARADALLK